MRSNVRHKALFQLFACQKVVLYNFRHGKKLFQARLSQLFLPHFNPPQDVECFSWNFSHTCILPYTHTYTCRWGASIFITCTTITQHRERWFNCTVYIGTTPTQNIVILKYVILLFVNEFMIIFLLIFWKKIVLSQTSTF